MKAIELAGDIDDQHRLNAQVPEGGPVFVPAADQLASSGSLAKERTLTHALELTCKQEPTGLFFHHDYDR